MRLSEAIRLGAMLSPQTRGAFFSRRGDAVATCALGAASVATGIGELAGMHLSEQWPILDMIVPRDKLPQELRFRHTALSIANAVMALNDSAGWSRNRIADWVEKFEEPKIQADDEDDAAAILVCQV